ncbi:nuclear transport factor 2 family protein [Ilyomonas limi]|uniref:Nuclear transport factor 2 family protein n=1 Tax=Ilyomonas limi TaxID=2575867 RepID=A0A4U3L4Q0_9BACT|nr:nuclear transport factor 2 family protein [Ilyomonas limi]TKK68616.1 nuclear transport factor 2 family protein [Ilyomonas limi]
MSVDILTIAKNYLKALKLGKTGKDLAIFFHEDVKQVEMPNRLNPNGSTSDLNTLLERAEQGKKIVKSQDYQIRNAIVQDNTVVLELDWSGVLNVHIGTLNAGQTMKAHFAMFIDFKDGKIIHQRNYDCFEAF